jgi:hypothetical protein
MTVIDRRELLTGLAAVAVAGAAPALPASAAPPVADLKAFLPPRILRHWFKVHYGYDFPIVDDPKPRAP